MNPTRVDRRASTAAKGLEKAWRMIQKIQPCLPAVVIVVMASGRRRKKGHFSGRVWRTTNATNGHEITVNPKLFDCPEDLVNTLLHEAAHALLFEWGLNARCGPDNIYHREEFRNVCRKLGLECTFLNRRYGPHKAYPSNIRVC